MTKDSQALHHFFEEEKESRYYSKLTWQGKSQQQQQQQQLQQKHDTEVPVMLLATESNPSHKGSGKKSSPFSRQFITRGG